jgi:uncharacterized protein (TIGR02757 family)
MSSVTGRAHPDAARPLRARLNALGRLKPELDRLYAAYDRAAVIADPVELVRRYPLVADREVVAFLAAGLAFGRVASVNQSVERVLGVLGSRPADYVRCFRLDRDAPAFAGFVHRWTRARELVHVLLALQRMLLEAGSVERWFARGCRATDADVTDAIESFGRRALDGGLEAAAYFFPRPSRGSACKRMNLFLRWMVRHDAVDPGGWTLVRPAQLIVPLDTHVIRVGQCLGLTRYRGTGWRMAREITESLRAIDPDDPVKYDFALCHVGMHGLCGFNRGRGNAMCPLRSVCRPGPRTRAASRAPSGRP